MSTVLPGKRGTILHQPAVMERKLRPIVTKQCQLKDTVVYKCPPTQSVE